MSVTNKWKDGRPPVGEECEIQVSDTGALFRDCKILYIDSMSVVFSSSAASSMPKYLSDVKFHPKKTPEEIERERVLKLAENTHRDASRGVYGSELRYFAELLYYAGLLTDKKVKPLDVADFVNIRLNSATVDVQYRLLVEGGYIIGADNNLSTPPTREQGE